MNFVSDRQRKAMFCRINSFSNSNSFAKRAKSNLELFTDDLGRLRVSSGTTADTSFLLSTDMDPLDTKKFISELDEEALAGLKKVAIVRPKVMQEYNAEPGYYTLEDEKVPFGKFDTPKIIATAERRGRGGSDFVPGVAKDIGRAAFQNMYKTISRPDEGGFAIKSDLPEDLLEEVYLLQVYSDYKPSIDMLEKIDPFRQDLEDEVWRIRALQRLGHPSTMEARAWRMGHQPRVDVETFVEFPKRNYVKSGKYIKEEEVTKPVDTLYDLYKNKTEPVKVAEISEDSWKKDSELAFKNTADLMLSGKFEVVSRLDDSYLNNMIDYTTGHWNPAYGVVRERLVAEKERRGNI